MMNIEQAIELAIDTLKYSYAPYSKFQVAAVLVTEEGKAYTGVNVENAAYPATNCAERTAFFKAVSEGEKNFAYIVIVGGIDGVLSQHCAPCGICRQVMREFGNPESFRIILAKTPTDYKEFVLKEILPLGFGPEDFV